MYKVVCGSSPLYFANLVSQHVPPVICDLIMRIFLLCLVPFQNLVIVGKVWDR